MNDLHKALGDISSIRMQVAQSTEFRGYGPATLAATGALSVGAAALQARWLANPSAHISSYLSIWICAAVLSAGLAGVQMITRSRRMHSSMSNQMIRAAMEQFVPCVVAGSLLTVVLVRNVSGAAWMLPGLWQILYSLGIFASCRVLPRHMFAAAAWYLMCGLVCVAIGDSRALSPWAMGVPFGAGQVLVAAALLFTTREVDDES
jgi:hypothetical protein